MSKSITLVQGASYTYHTKKYMRGVSEPVDKNTFNYLMATGKFTDTTNVPKVSQKIKITKPDESEAETEVPTFRSKKELADYAEEEYGLVFEGDFKDLKMKEMMEVISDHLQSESKIESEEIVEV